MSRECITSRLYAVQNQRGDGHAYVEDEVEPVCRRMVKNEVPVTGSQMRDGLALRRCALCEWALREFLRPWNTEAA